MIDIKGYILDLLFPRRCAICDRTVLTDEKVCPDCRDKIKVIEGPVCMKCGKRLSDEEALYCYDCSRKQTAFDRGIAVFDYDFIKESLYRFKYGSRAEYARFYAEVTWERYREVLNVLGVEALIPVPIHRRRFNKRGYNQATEYADCLSGYTGIPVRDDIVVRSVYTIPLKKMGPDERQKNLKKAFKLAKNDVKFRKVCIVDDIYTTGATIDALANILKGIGVERVYFITIAIGRGL